MGGAVVTVTSGMGIGWCSKEAWVLLRRFCKDQVRVYSWVFGESEVGGSIPSMYVTGLLGSLIRRCSRSITLPRLKSVDVENVRIMREMKLWYVAGKSESSGLRKVFGGREGNGKSSSRK